MAATLDPAILGGPLHPAAPGAGGPGDAACAGEAAWTVLPRENTSRTTPGGREAAVAPVTSRASGVRAIGGLTFKVAVDDLPGTPSSGEFDFVPQPPPDALDILLSKTPAELAAAGESPILRARCEDVARRIIRDGGQVSVASLAREIGCANATVKRLLSSALFTRVYAEVNDDIMGTIDERIIDERADIVVRQTALQQRAMSVLGDVLAAVRKHNGAVSDGNATLRPGILKLGIEAAAEIRQIGTARAAAAAGGTTVNIQGVTVTKNQATIIQGAMREAGVDLSDILDGLTLAPPPPSKGEAA